MQHLEKKMFTMCTLCTIFLYLLTLLFFLQCFGNVISGSRVMATCKASHKHHLTPIIPLQSEKMLHAQQQRHD